MKNTRYFDFIEKILRNEINFFETKRQFKFGEQTGINQNGSRSWIIPAVVVYRFGLQRRFRPSSSRAPSLITISFFLSSISIQNPIPYGKFANLPVCKSLSVPRRSKKCNSPQGINCAVKRRFKSVLERKGKEAKEKREETGRAMERKKEKGGRERKKEIETRFLFFGRPKGSPKMVLISAAISVVNCLQSPLQLIPAHPPGIYYSQ